MRIFFPLHPSSWQAARTRGWQVPWHAPPIHGRGGGKQTEQRGGMGLSERVPEELWPSLPRPPHSFLQGGREGECSGFTAQGERWASPQSVPGASPEGHSLVLSRSSSACSSCLHFSCKATVFRLTPADLWAARLGSRPCPGRTAEPRRRVMLRAPGAIPHRSGWVWDACKLLNLLQWLGLFCCGGDNPPSSVLLVAVAFERRGTH